MAGNPGSKGPVDPPEYLERALAALATSHARVSDDAVWDLAVLAGRFLRNGARLGPIPPAPGAAKVVLSRIARLDFPSVYARTTERLRKMERPLGEAAAMKFLRERDDAQAAWSAVMAIIDPVGSSGATEANRRLAEMRQLWAADEAFFGEFAWAFIGAEKWVLDERSRIAAAVTAAECPWHVLLPRAWREVWYALPVLRAVGGPARGAISRDLSRTHARLVDRAFRRALNLPARAGKSAILDALGPGAAAAADEMPQRRFAFASLVDRLAGDLGVLRVRMRAPGERPAVTGGKDATVEVDVAIDRAGALRFVFADGNGKPRADVDGSIVHLGLRLANVKDGVAVIPCDDPPEFYRRLRALPDSLSVVWIDGRILYGVSVTSEIRGEKSAGR